MQTAGSFDHNGRFQRKVGEEVGEKIYLVPLDWTSEICEKRHLLIGVISTTLLSETPSFKKEQEGNGHGRAQEMEAEAR